MLYVPFLFFPALCSRVPSSNILSIISSPVLLILFCDYISSYACLSDILIFGYLYLSEYAINFFAISLWLLWNIIMYHKANVMDC